MILDNQGFDFFKKYEFIFLDFDGVIKESIETKSLCFKKLFEGNSPFLIEKMIRHHSENGGLSRFKKIPIYLNWFNLDTSEENIEFFCEKFSALCIEEVVNSPWVKGVLLFLEKTKLSKNLFLVSATPQSEIILILKKLEIDFYFDEIYGYPNKKEEIIRSFLKVNAKKDKVVLIGDSYVDYLSAKKNNIDFILRKTNFNNKLQKEFNGKCINNFLEVS